MRYEFKLRDDQFMHVETGECAGYVVPLKSGKGFCVHRALTYVSERDRIAVVKSMEEALPTLTTYYEQHPPQWKRIRESRYDRCGGYTMCTVFSKWTFYGVFDVKQNEPGRWVASRCNDALLREGQAAVFPTSEVARHVADLHERDGVGNYPVLNDGYSWKD
jgi:hypothetical protein